LLTNFKIKFLLILTILVVCSTSLAQIKCSKVLNSPEISKETKPEFKPLEFKLITSRVESLAVRLAAIRKAKHTIELAVFIFKRDEAGKLVIKELKDALDRGVNIKLLIDGFGSAVSNGLLRNFRDELNSLKRYSTEENVPGTFDVHYTHSILNIKDVVSKSFIKLFEQGILKHKDSAPLNYNQRIHDKLMVADGGYKSALIFTGGSNIGNAYNGIGSHKKGNYVDLDIVLKPEVSRENLGEGDSLRTSYNRYIDMILRETPSRELQGKMLKLFPNLFYKSDINNISQLKPDEYNSVIFDKLHNLKEEDYFNHGFTKGEGQLLSEYNNLISSNSSMQGSWYKAQNTSSSTLSIKKNFYEQMEKSEKLIEIVTPYPILTNSSLRRIEKILLEKPNLEIHLFANNKKFTDKVMVYLYFSRIIFPKIIKLNNNKKINNRFKVFMFDGALTGEGKYVFNHSKLARFDNEKVLISSSNFDPRSFRLNSESGLLLQGKSVSEQFDDHINLIKNNSKEISDLELSKRMKKLPEWKKKAYGLVEKLLVNLNFTTQL